MSNPLTPPASVIVKAASLIVHAEEFFSEGGHDFDRLAFLGLYQDTEIGLWLRDLEKLQLLPKKRK